MIDLGTVLAAGSVVAAIPVALGILLAFMVLAPIVGFSLWTFKVVDRQVALALAFPGMMR